MFIQYDTNFNFGTHAGLSAKEVAETSPEYILRLKPIYKFNASVELELLAFSKLIESYLRKNEEINEKEINTILEMRYGFSSTKRKKRTNPWK